MPSVSLSLLRKYKRIVAIETDPSEQHPKSRPSRIDPLGSLLLLASSSPSGVTKTRGGSKLQFDPTCHWP